MTREEIIQGLYRGESRAIKEAIKALEQESRPMEKFESAKDHIYKLAGDYKCWDNRLTDDEALELCHILEQKPCEDAVSRKSVLNKIKEVCFSEDWLQFRVDNGSNGQRDFLINYIEELPLVTPTKCIATVKFSKDDMRELIDEKMKEIVVERKKGKWIGTCRIGFGEFADCEVELIGGFVADNCHCSECGEELEKGERGIYCPNCGCKMSK